MVLEKEYSEPELTGHMELLRQQRDAMGDTWPEALFPSKSTHGGDMAAAQAAMRMGAACKVT